MHLHAIKGSCMTAVRLVGTWRCMQQEALPARASCLHVQLPMEHATPPPNTHTHTNTYTYTHTASLGLHRHARRPKHCESQRFHR